MTSIIIADVSVAYLDAIERLINRVGLPTALVIAACLGIWRASSWFGTKVAEPLVGRATAGVDAHIVFLQESTRASQASAVSVGATAASVGQVLANQRGDSEKIDDIHGVIVRSTGTTQQQVSATSPSKTTACPPA